jgi:hypothetical protein
LRRLSSAAIQTQGFADTTEKPCWCDGVVMLYSR